MLTHVDYLTDLADRIERGELYSIDPWLLRNASEYLKQLKDYYENTKTH